MSPTSNSLYEDKHFRALIENSADAIQIVTPEGDVLYSSDSVKSVLGYTPKEVQGVNVAPYLHPDDVAGFMKKWLKLLKKPLSRDTIEYRVRHKKGHYVWLETNVTNHMETPGINAVLGNFRNIGARKEAEARLKDSEQQFRLLSDLSPVAITVHAGGKILYLNQAGAKMIGAKSPKEVVGQPIARFIHPDYLQVVAERVKVIMRENKPTPLFREKFVRLDGGVIDVEVISLPITYDGQKAIQVVVRDVTEEKEAEEALRASEERLRFMAESMPQKIFTAGSDGRIDYVNPQWLKYSGLTLKELLGRGWEGMVHPDDLQAVRKKWKHSVKTGEDFSLEMRYRRKDGVYRWHISRAQAMLDKDGGITRWFGSNTDIDDIRSALQREHALEKRTLQLAEQRTQLIELNKAKDEFIALASHQLRTPATAVKQYLGMALQGYGGELSEPQKSMIIKANESNNRQINIVNDLLQVARLDGGSIKLNEEPVHIMEIVEESIDEIRETLKQRKQRIILSKGRKDVVLMTDPVKLRMVFENPLGNASKYSFEDTIIKVSIRSDKKRVRVIVEDQGVGIGPEDIDKLFKKFSRIDNPLSLIVGGTGLGLYWASKVVELHGGDITVESSVGKGSKFTVILPLGG